MVEMLVLLLGWPFLPFILPLLCGKEYVLGDVDAVLASSVLLQKNWEHVFRRITGNAALTSYSPVPAAATFYHPHHVVRQLYDAPAPPPPPCCLARRSWPRRCSAPASAGAAPPVTAHQPLLLAPHR